MKLDYVKVPFTNNPSMTRFDGPIYNKNPDKRYLIDKEKQFNFFEDSIYGQTTISKENNLLEKLLVFFNFEKTLNIKDLSRRLEEDFAIMFNGNMELGSICFPSNRRAESGDLQDVIEIRILLFATARLPIQPQVLSTGQVWQEPWSLDERSDVCVRSGSREDRLSEDVRVPSRRVDEPHDHAHRRRLARSVWSEKAEDRTLGDLEGDITDSVDPPLELLGQVLNRDRSVCQVFAGQCPRTSRPQQANRQRYDENTH